MAHPGVGDDAFGYPNVMRTQRFSDEQIEELQQRLDEVEHDIDEAERKARELEHRDEHHWVDSGDEGQDDQTITPPG